MVPSATVRGRDLRFGGAAVGSRDSRRAARELASRLLDAQIDADKARAARK